MNKSILFGVFLLIAIYCSAQNYPPKSDSTFTYYAEVGIGAAMPSGEFKFYSAGENVGYAKPGIALFLNAKAYQNQFMGYALSFSGMINPVDDTFYTIDQTSQTLRADIGMWKNINFGIGPFFYTSGNDIFFELKLPIGFVTVNRPEVLVYNYYANTGSINRLYTYTGGHSLSWCFTPEVSMSFDLNDNIKLKVFGNYLISNINLNYQLVYGDPITGSNTQTNAVGLEQKLKLRNISAGVAFVFELEK